MTVKARPKASRKKRGTKTKKKPVFNKPHTPSKYTFGLQQAIAAMVQSGNFASVAVVFHGISAKTHRRWMSTGEAEVERYEADPLAETDPYKIDYVNYYNAIMKAEAFAEVRAVNIVTGRRNVGEEQPSGQDIQGAKWWLERSKKERWAVGHDINLHGPNGGPIEINITESEFMSKLSAANIIAISQIFTTIENGVTGDPQKGGDVGPLPIPSTGVAADRPGNLPE
jgi:hypothetical protein